MPISGTPNFDALTVTFGYMGAILVFIFAANSEGVLVSLPETSLEFSAELRGRTIWYVTTNDQLKPRSADSAAGTSGCPAVTSTVGCAGDPTEKPAFAASIQLAKSNPTPSNLLKDTVEFLGTTTR